MTKNSFRPGRGGMIGAAGSDGAGMQGAGGLMEQKDPALNPLAGIGGGQNLMGLPAQGGGMAMPPHRDGGPTLAGGGPGGVMTANAPPLSAPPPSLTDGSPQDQVNAAYGAPQFEVNSMGVPGLEGLAGGGVLKAKGVPQISQG